MDELLKRMIKIVRERATLDAVITPVTRFEDVADSLAMVEIIMEVEENLNIDIPDEKIDTFKTIQELYEFVKEQK